MRICPDVQVEFGEEVAGVCVRLCHGERCPEVAHGYIDLCNQECSHLLRGKNKPEEACIERMSLVWGL